MVPKSSGGWRSCGNYRRLNQVTIPDRHHVPHLQNFSVHLARKYIFFKKIDLIRGYHPVALGDIPKTAIITPFGLFEFTKMLFGLRNAAAFQMLIDEGCRGLSFVFACIDDLLVTSSDEAEHLAHLEYSSKRFQDNGPAVNTSRCKFGSTQMDSWAMTSMSMAPHP